LAERGLRKVRVGKVTSDKMDKTVVVSIETSEKHPLYKNSLRELINSRLMMKIMNAKLVI